MVTESLAQLLGKPSDVASLSFGKIIRKEPHDHSNPTARLHRANFATQSTMARKIKLGNVKMGRLHCGGVGVTEKLC